MDELRRVAKAQLRARIRNIRRLLSDAARAKRSAAIVERVIALDEVAHARTILGYHPLPKEVDILALLQWAAAQGKQLGLPRVQGEQLMLHRWQPGEPLVAGAFGIQEPGADAPMLQPAEVDVVLVPALAADPDGHRVGYGRGFYDRLLPTLARALRVTPIYDFQLVVEVPRAPSDVPVHVVVTDARTIVAHAR